MSHRASVSVLRSLVLIVISHWWLLNRQRVAYRSGGTLKARFFHWFFRQALASFAFARHDPCQHTQDAAQAGGGPCLGAPACSAVAPIRPRLTTSTLLGSRRKSNHQHTVALAPCCSVLYYDYTGNAQASHRLRCVLCQLAMPMTKPPAANRHVVSASHMPRRQ